MLKIITTTLATVACAVQIDDASNFSLAPSMLTYAQTEQQFSVESLASKRVSSQDQCDEKWESMKKKKRKKLDLKFNQEACACFVEFKKPQRDCSNEETNTKVNPFKKNPKKDNYCISQSDYDLIFQHTLGPDCIVGTDDDTTEPTDDNDSGTTDEDDNDGSTDPTDGGETDGGETDGGETDGGETDGGSDPTDSGTDENNEDTDEIIYPVDMDEIDFNTTDIFGDQPVTINAEQTTIIVMQGGNCDCTEHSSDPDDYLDGDTTLIGFASDLSTLVDEATINTDHVVVQVTQGGCTCE